MAPSERFILLVGGDLLGTDRLLTASRAAGFELRKTTVAGLEDALAHSSPALLVIDLDGGRHDAVNAVARARDRGLLPDRTVGYFSHVDTTLADSARAAGIEAWPRGRFWNSLGDLLPNERG
ncbi:MAG: hypothetical protein M3285_13160 [Actinomycetota bacterium]|nr:hypothetical protein [Actinomycetota bacterium]